MTCVSHHPLPSPPCSPKAGTNAGTRHEAFTERWAHDSETTEGRSSDTVKQKSSCGSRETPQGIARWPNRKDITSSCPFYALPLSTAPAAVSQPARWSPAQLGETRPLLTVQPALSGRKILGFTGFPSRYLAEVSSLQLSKQLTGLQASRMIPVTARSHLPTTCSKLLGLALLSSSS